MLTFMHSAVTTGYEVRDDRCHVTKGRPNPIKSAFDFLFYGLLHGFSHWSLGLTKVYEGRDDRRHGTKEVQSDKISFRLPFLLPSSRFYVTRPRA